jgi:hypothetical protein
MPEALPHTPPAVALALDRLKSELSRAAGNNFAGLIVYGGVARGRYRPGRSDVNVVVLLRDASAAMLAAIAPALRAARRSANVAPLILSAAEVQPAALVFPTKFLDIKDHHIVILGDDPFASLDVPRQHVSWRIVQELRNLTLRLRHHFVAAGDDREAQMSSLARIARPLAIELTALLRLAGKPVPQEDRSATIFQEAAAAFGVDGETLASLAGLRQGERLKADLLALFGGVLKALAALTEQAERLKEAPQ